MKLGKGTTDDLFHHIIMYAVSKSLLTNETFNIQH